MAQETQTNTGAAAKTPPKTTAKKKPSAKQSMTATEAKKLGLDPVPYGKAGSN